MLGICFGVAPHPKPVQTVGGRCVAGNGQRACRPQAPPFWIGFLGGGAASPPNNATLLRECQLTPSASWRIQGSHRGAALGTQRKPAMTTTFISETIMQQAADLIVRTRDFCGNEREAVREFAIENGFKAEWQKIH